MPVASRRKPRRLWSPPSTRFIGEVLSQRETDQLPICNATHCSITNRYTRQAPFKPGQAVLFLYGPWRSSVRKICKYIFWSVDKLNERIECGDVNSFHFSVELRWRRSLRCRRTRTARRLRHFRRARRWLARRVRQRRQADRPRCAMQDGRPARGEPGQHTFRCGRTRWQACVRAILQRLGRDSRPHLRLQR